MMNQSYSHSMTKHKEVNSIYFYHRLSRMVNKWYFQKTFFLKAEDSVQPLLVNFLFQQQKIGRSSVAKNLDAEDPVLFCINKSFFGNRRSVNSNFQQLLLTKSYLRMQKIGRSSASLYNGNHNMAIIMTNIFENHLYQLLFNQNRRWSIMWVSTLFNQGK